MSTNSFTVAETYKLHFFACCGANVGMPESWEPARRRDGKRFYCPHCGTYWFYTPGPTEADKLKEELANVKHHVAWLKEASDRSQRDADHFKRKAAAARGLVTKLKNKAAQGECPCCGQYFPDLHSHITSAHPEFVENKDNGDVLEKEEADVLVADKPLIEQVKQKAVAHSRGKAECPHCGRFYKNKRSLASHIHHSHKENA
jgi:uncharacterized C2H2 Zn-finger protein